MTRDLRMFELWIAATRSAAFNLRNRQFNAALPTMDDLAIDYAGCQSNAIAFASR